VLYGTAEDEDEDAEEAGVKEVCDGANVRRKDIVGVAGIEQATHLHKLARVFSRVTRAIASSALAGVLRARAGCL
jgi:hypothetical protein